MKITTTQLRQIIKEEIKSTIESVAINEIEIEGSDVDDRILTHPDFYKNLKQSEKLFNILMDAIDSQFKTGNAVQKIKMILPQVIKAFQKVGRSTEIEPMIQMVDNVLNATKRSNTGIG